MSTIPFHPEVWKEKEGSNDYRLTGFNIRKPSPSDYTTADYAKYSKKYWDGVRARAYNYRMLKKIEYQDWLKHG
jgi:hypothetical protein